MIFSLDALVDAKLFFFYHNVGICKYVYHINVEQMKSYFMFVTL